MVHSVSGWTRGVQVKLWDPLRMRAIPERLRGVFTTRRYTNPRLPLPLPLISKHISKRTHQTYKEADDALFERAMKGKNHVMYHFFLQLIVKLKLSTIWDDVVMNLLRQRKKIGHLENGNLINRLLYKDVIDTTRIETRHCHCSVVNRVIASCVLAACFIRGAFKKFVERHSQLRDTQIVFCHFFNIFSCN